MWWNDVVWASSFWASPRLHYLHHLFGRKTGSNLSKMSVIDTDDIPKIFVWAASISHLVKGEMEVTNKEKMSNFYLQPAKQTEWQRYSTSMRHQSKCHWVLSTVIKVKITFVKLTKDYNGFFNHRGVTCSVIITYTAVCVGVSLSWFL